MRQKKRYDFAAAARRAKQLFGAAVGEKAGSIPPTPPITPAAPLTHHNGPSQDDLVRLGDYLKTCPLEEVKRPGMFLLVAREDKATRLLYAERLGLHTVPERRNWVERMLFAYTQKIPIGLPPDWRSTCGLLLSDLLTPSRGSKRKETDL